MRIVPLFRTIAQLRPRRGRLWPDFGVRVFGPYRDVFLGLRRTYGQVAPAEADLPALVEQAGPSIQAHLRQLVADSDPMAAAERGLELAASVIPGLRHGPERLAANGSSDHDTISRWLDAVPIILGTLFYLAPAATLDISGEPGVVIGLERFVPGAPPPGVPRGWLHSLDRLPEIIVHELAHVARMRACSLPPSPLRLSLHDMLWLEGSAIVTADRALGRETIRDLLGPDELARHELAGEAIVRETLHLRNEVGLAPFLRHFGHGALVSGYYVGWQLARRWLGERPDDPRYAALLTLPAEELSAGAWAR